MIALAIRVDVPPNTKGIKPAAATTAAASQSAQMTRRSCPVASITCGILSCVPPQDKRISGQIAVFSFARGPADVLGDSGGGRPAGTGHRLPERQPPEEGGDQERHGEDR